MKRNRTVEQFLNTAPQWNAELTTLCEILRSTGLEETIKWGSPVYCRAGKNVVGVGGFKSYFGLWFFQGALLDDPRQVLVNAQDGKTKAQRQMRFHSARDIQRPVITRYVRDAIRLADAGIAIKPDRNKPVEIPPELTDALANNRVARQIFEAMSKSCRREYAEYIASAKQPATKQRRLEKILPMIESRGGLNDKYR